MRAGSWDSAADWEERAIISDHAIALLHREGDGSYEGRRDQQHVAMHIWLLLGCGMHLDVSRRGARRVLTTNRSWTHSVEGPELRQVGIWPRFSSWARFEVRGGYRPLIWNQLKLPHQSSACSDAASDVPRLEAAKGSWAPPINVSAGSAAGSKGD